MICLKNKIFTVYKKKLKHNFIFLLHLKTHYQILICNLLNFCFQMIRINIEKLNIWCMSCTISRRIILIKFARGNLNICCSICIMIKYDYCTLISHCINLLIISNIIQIQESCRCKKSSVFSNVQSNNILTLNIYQNDHINYNFKKNTLI